MSAIEAALKLSTLPRAADMALVELTVALGGALSVEALIETLETHAPRVLGGKVRLVAQEHEESAPPAQRSGWVERRASVRDPNETPWQRHRLAVETGQVFNLSIERARDEEIGVLVEHLRGALGRIQVHEGAQKRGEQILHELLVLQRRMLPRVAQVHGLSVSSSYHSGQGTLSVGGDWYDLVSVAPGKTTAIIGDVMGSGVEAASIMGEVRIAARTCASLGLGPLEILDHLGHLVDREIPDLITCLVATIEDTGRVRVASRGHLPPVVGGAQMSRIVELEPGPPLGVEGPEPTLAEFVLEPGQILALFTDGLVESRGLDIELSMKALGAQLVLIQDEQERPYPLWAEELFARMRALVPNTDDTGLLLVRRE